MKYQECFARSSPWIRHQKLCTLPLKLCTDDVLEIIECKRKKKQNKCMDYITCQYEPTGVFSKKCFRSHDDTDCNDEESQIPTGQPLECVSFVDNLMCT